LMREVDSGAEARLAKPAMNYTESEEEFAPQWGKPKKHALKKKGKEDDL
jgi:hypothetical protein